MDISKCLKFSIKSLGLIFAFGLTACVYDPHYHEHDHDGYYQDHHVHHPYYYDYWYYPSVSVYFHYSSGHYYYHSGKRWIRTKVLPPHIRLDRRERANIRIKGDKPYLKHQEHQKKYKSRGKFKADPEKDKQERAYHRRWRQENKEYRKEHREEREPHRKDKDSKNYKGKNSHR